MIGGLGMTELLLIFGIGLLLFGNRLPGVGKSLGESIRAFKKGFDEDKSEEALKGKSDRDLQAGRSLNQSQPAPQTQKEKVIDVNVEDKG